MTTSSLKKWTGIIPEICHSYPGRGLLIFTASLTLASKRVKKMENGLCPCGNPKPYSNCCEPILKGTKIAESPADLMRARYTAFVKQEIDFIINTVAPARRKDFDRKGIEDWSRDTDWAGLQIVSTERGLPGDEVGQVEFIARFREKEEVKEHHELASFVKIKGSWYFDDGKTPGAKPVRLEGPKIGRNDPCHCGSGKKFKKCHGLVGATA